MHLGIGEFMKTMRKVNRIILVALILTATISKSMAQQGPRDGGGGLVINCPTGVPFKNPILLDLYEFEEKYKIQIARVEATGDKATDKSLLDQELDKILNQKFLNKSYNVSLQKMLKHNVKVIQKKLESYLDALEKKQAETDGLKNEKSDSGFYLFSQMDMGLSKAILLPVGCSINTVAFMDPQTNLSIDPLFNKMSITDRAGLIIHESVYAIRRLLFGESDSGISREHTAFLISSTQSPNRALEYLVPPLGKYRAVILPSSKYLRFEAKLTNTAKNENLSIEILDNGQKIVTAHLDEANTSTAISFTHFFSEFPYLKMTPSMGSEITIKLIDEGNENSEVIFEGHLFGNSEPTEIKLIKIDDFWSRTPVAQKSQIKKIFGW